MKEAEWSDKLLDEEKIRPWRKLLSLFTWLGVALLILNFRNLKQYFLHFFHRDRVLLRRPSQQAVLVVIAVYEKGQLRSDICRLAQNFSTRNCCVVVINNSRVEEIASLDESIDVYIERFNYGRDFGAYQCGYRYANANGLLDAASRLVFLNDSIFYASQHLDSFVDALIEDDVDCLGATETFEIEHHLGSFALSFSRRVFEHQRFKRFWRKYRKTDLRPKTIKRGELGLSRVVSSISITDPPIRALFSYRRLGDRLSQDPSSIEELYRLTRTTNRLWQQSGFAYRIARARGQLALMHFSESDVALPADPSGIALGSHTGSFRDGLKAFSANVAGSPEDIERSFRDFIRADLLDQYVRGSQIHQNAVLLPALGCPIIKLDLVYRGACASWDIARLVDQLDPTDRGTLTEMLVSRPYGGNNLKGWKLAAFLRGHL
jgi:hypothetical protein